MEITRNFRNLDKGDVALAGGKGASLGEMTQAGIPVPGGFVVLSDSFEHFIHETKLYSDIDSILHKVNHEEMESVERASEEIQALILGAKMPKDIAEVIMSDFDRLGARFVAVRSSATSEDSSAAAWAGQLESYLNTTRDKVLENVQRCWASLFTPRAIFYRFEKGLHNTKISVAVVVQKMVESEISGIAFSVHPVTQDYNQLIIEAGYGLGEAIVSGQITPDSYVVEKHPRKIIEKNVAEQERGLFKKEGGGNEWRDIDSYRGGKQKLNEAQIEELAEIILRIERHYGFPCDIEWAYEAGKFYIVQSRPITTLMKKDDSSEEEVKKKDLLSEYSNIEDEGVKWLRFGQKKGALLSREINFKIQFDRRFTEAVKDFPYTMDNYKYINWTHYLDEKEYEINLKKMLDNAKRWGYVSSLIKQSNECLGKVLSIYKSFKLKDCSAKDLLEYFEEFIEYDAQIGKFIPAGNLLVRALSIETERILKEKLPKDSEEELSRKGNLIGFNEKENDFSLRQRQILECLAKNDLSRCRKIWEESKWMNIMFLTYLNTDESDFNKEISQIKDPADELKKLKENLDNNRYEREKIISSLNLTKEEMQIFDLLKESTLVELEVVRNYQIAQFKALGLLEKISEILQIPYSEMIYLTIEEIKDGLKGKSIPSSKEIKIRMEEGFSIIRINRKTEVVFSDFSHKLDFNSKEIKGLPVSKGRAQGKVKIILDISDIDKIEKGDILVTTMTTPNFIIGLKRAAAIVTNDGGITSHAAIVSRELGIPCVIGTKFATEVLKDGDFVEVDADRGIVRILEKKDKIKLSKIFQRDVSLAFCKIWSDASIKNFSKYFGENRKYLLYIKKSDDSPVEVWQNNEEKDEFFRNVSKLKENRLVEVLEETRELFEKLKPYYKGRKINSDKELREFSQNLMNWITVMGINFAVNEMKQDKRFKEMREEMQEYVYVGSDIIADYIRGKVKNDKIAYSLTVEEFLSGKYPKRNGWMMYNSEVRSLDELNSLLDKKGINLLDSEKQEVSEINGQIAFKGKVTGKVRIVLIKKDISKAQEGEILVASMTSPDYLPAMKKAAAFVTNEGGVVCHAAIVARELGKPCIIGTKVATDVLKDGDLVEVDATNGIVRILKRKK